MPVPKVVNTKGRPQPPKPKSLSTASSNAGNAAKSSSSPVPVPELLIVPTAVINFEDVRPDFRDIVESLYNERRSVKATEDKVIEQRKELDETLDNILIDLNVGKINMPDGFVISLVKSSSASKVDAKLLLALGVSADTVKAATVPGNPYKYVLVADRNPKEKD